ncbi:MAG TPA: PilZ domain-containing protein [Bauldia sp.]
METDANHTRAVTDDNRRRSPRMRTLKGGRIVTDSGNSVFDCTIRNLSETGAMLALSNPFGIPAHFDLMLQAPKPRRPCTVRWRSDAALGVSFDDMTSIAA